MNEFGLLAKFVLTALATWRVTHLLALEDGPGHVIARLRAVLGAGRLAGLMDCFKCLSLWVAAPAALWLTRRPDDWAPAWLALSGAACLLERLGAEPVVIERINDLPSAKGEAEEHKGA